MDEHKIHLIKENKEVDDDFLIFSTLLLIGVLIIGIIFLIPPILGVIFFILRVFNIVGGYASLKYLGADWTGGDGAMSAASIYLGLMAIAGAFLVSVAILAFIKMYKGFD